MLRSMGMYYKKRLLFHKKSLDIDPIFVKKSLEVGPISKKKKKKKKKKK